MPVLLYGQATMSLHRTRTFTLCWLLAGLVLLPLVPAHGMDGEEEAQPLAPLSADDATDEVTEPQENVAYTLRIEGIEDATLRSLLEKASQLVSLAHRPPLSEAGLRRRIDDDRERFNTIFRAEGYYAAQSEARIDDSATPLTVIILVDLGPLFTFKSFSIEQTAGAEDMPPLPSLLDLGIRIGAPARAADVVGAEKRLTDFCANNGHPLARTEDRHAIVDHADQTMTVSLALDPGPELTFGPVNLTGLDQVVESYVRLLIPWNEGDTYDRRKVEDLRRRLVNTSLFSSVLVIPAAAPNEAGQLPITIDFIEGKNRSFGAGAKYYTSEGPAVELFWEHRNAFGRGERVNVSTEIGTILQKMSLEILFPNYQRIDQDLIGAAEATRETTDAYDKVGVETSARIRRKLNDAWTVSSGPSLETAWIKERNEEQNNSTLLGLPSYAYRDTTDNALNPTKGTRLRIAPTPYVGWYNQRQHFLSNELSGSGYVSLDPASRYVLASRVKVGTLFGESRGDIPADKRFYAGGGSSIRGYPYQKVGPLDSSHDPLGGRSLLEMSAEFRARVWGNFGIVPFIDGGSVYDAVAPDLSETMRWGVGLGLRYYTVIGPVRFDVAFPINRRNQVDDFVQFYVNIGQAF